MNKCKRSVGWFYSRDETEKALRAFKDDDFDMNRVNHKYTFAELGDRITCIFNLDRDCYPYL